ncbi:MAG: hypothetical protein R3267_03020 [Paenisporosarcina sp.]|nr:hypothetical protein [Paenisporosarcina sp.]
MNPIYMGSPFFGGVIGRLVFPIVFQLFSTNFFGFSTIQIVFQTNSQVFPTIRPEVDTILL